MARTRHIQSVMTSGEVAPTLHGRIESDLYRNAMSKAQNTLIMPHGGMRRRPGLQKITDNYLNAGNTARMEPFVFSRTESYLMVFENLSVKIYESGTLVATVVTPFTAAQLFELDVIQSADTVIITHEDHYPRRLVRGASSSIWTLSNLPLVGIPTYDFGSGAEPVWSVTRGYPRTCTFHTGRLWFGGSRSLVNAVWGSVAGDLFNFAVGTGADDDAIFDILDSDVYNEINGIVSATNLQIFTKSQEFFNTSKVITPASSSWVSYSTLGSQRIRPLFVNGATLWIDSSSRTMRQSYFNDDEQTYTPENASILSSHLLNDCVSTATIKGTATDFSDLVFVVNGDGTAAVLNTMRNQGIHGWTQWTTDGTFKDVAVVDKEVYFLVERSGSYFIEQMKEGTYSDHNTVVEGTPPTVNNVVFGLDNVVTNGDNVVFQTPGSGVAITSVQTNINDAIAYQQLWRVTADSSVLASSLPINEGVNTNRFDLGRDAYHAEVGLDYPVVLRTLALNVATQGDGWNVDLRKRVNRVILRLFESLGVQVEDTIMNDRKFIVTLDQAPVPYTGIKEVYLLGYGRIVEIEISQSDPLPFTLLSIDSEVEY